MATWVQVVAIIGGILGTGTGIAALFYIPSQIKKFRADVGQTKAEAAETLSTASIALMQPAVAEATRLRTELTEARQQVSRLTYSLGEAQLELAQLRGQVDRLSKDLAAQQEENERLKKQRRPRQQP